MGRLPVPPQARLLDVSAADARTAFVVGAVAQGTGTRPIALRWDGKRWEEIDAGLPEEGINGELDEVAAVSDHDAWALTAESPPRDRSERQPGTNRLYRWNGSSWQLARTIHADLTYSGVHVLSATQDGQVWLGSIEFAELWNGRSWHSEPAPSRCGCYISHITTQPGAGVWAITGRVQAGNIVSGDVLHWEGQAWRIVPAPSRIQLDGIADVSPTGAWVMGHWCPAPGIIHSGEAVCLSSYKNVGMRIDHGPWGRQEPLPDNVIGQTRIATDLRGQIWLYPAQARAAYYDGRHWSRATGAQNPAGICPAADPSQLPAIANVPGTSTFLVAGTAKDGSGPCVAVSVPTH
jgi:hypothetical protein